MIKRISGRACGLTRRTGVEIRAALGNPCNAQHEHKPLQLSGRDVWEWVVRGFCMSQSAEKAAAGTPSQRSQCGE